MLQTIPLALAGGPALPDASNQLLLRVSVRRTCVGGHLSRTARLRYNGQDVDRGATRDAVDATTASYYLRAGSSLSTAAGASQRWIDRFVDVKVACRGRLLGTFDTWSISPRGRPAYAPPSR